jgi:hypothetical protein
VYQLRGRHFVMKTKDSNEKIHWPLEYCSAAFCNVELVQISAADGHVWTTRRLSRASNFGSRDVCSLKFHANTRFSILRRELLAGAMLLCFRFHFGRGMRRARYDYFLPRLLDGPLRVMRAETIFHLDCDTSQSLEIPLLVFGSS